MTVLGIDIGGTGIKGAPVDVEKGELLSERFRVLTPQPATVDDVAECVAQIVKHFSWKGRIGCGFPSAIKHGMIMTAANIDDSWIGVNAKTVFELHTGCKAHIINDADAAGWAEIHFGAGRGVQGVVICVTVGTGIGTAIFSNGVLLPNTELGHLMVRGKEAEHRASDRVRREKELSWKKWAKRFNEYLTYLEKLFWPDMIIIGGGLSKDFVKFASHLTIQAPVVAAEMLNEAGIIGAALSTLHPEV